MVETYKRFAYFLSLPDSERVAYLDLQKDPTTGKYPNPSQELFAKKFGVSKKTLSTWKKKPDLIAIVDNTRKQWGLDRVPNVLQALYNRCVKYGMAYDVETYLAYFDNWNRTQISKITVEKVDPDDLRTIIKMLPMDKQIEAYEKLADIIGAAHLERNIKEVHGHTLTESRANSEVSEEEADLTTPIA